GTATSAGGADGSALAAGAGCATGSAMPAGAGGADGSARTGGAASIRASDWLMSRYAETPIRTMARMLPPTTIIMSERAVASDTVVPPRPEMIPDATLTAMTSTSRPPPRPIAPSFSWELLMVLARLPAAYHDRGQYRPAHPTLIAATVGARSAARSRL